MSDVNDKRPDALVTNTSSAETIATTVQAQFPSTSITELVKVRGDDEAASKTLAILCQNYWYPLYAFLRRRGHNEEDAKDLTQGFFQSFLSGKAFEGFDPKRGRLRSYLLGALKHHEANWKRHNRTIKAGGEVNFVSIEWMRAEKLYKAEPSDVNSPDRIFDRRWALTLLQSAQNALRNEFTQRGKSDQFDALYPFIDGNPPGRSQADAASELGMTTDAVKTALSRMRGRRRDILRSQIAMTVASEKLVDEEIGYLLGLFESKPGNPAY